MRDLIEAPAGGDLPEGFRESASGLILPEEVARKQDTWTPEEWAIVERAASFVAKRKGAILRLFCVECLQSGKAGLLEMVHTPYGRTLRCDHMDRRLYRGDEAACNKDARDRERLRMADERRARRAARRGQA